MDFTAFRQNVQDMFGRELGEHVPLAMQPGLLEGPNETRTGNWMGSVAIQRVIEDPRNVAQAQIYLICRVFPPFRAQVSPNKPYDPTELEQMATWIQDAVARNQTMLGAWYQRVTGIDFDVEDQGVQWTVFAYTDNDSITLA